MFHRLSNGTIQSSLLSLYPQLTHAYTTRKLGDMKKSKKNRDSFLQKIFSDADSLVLAQQVHGNDIGVVDGKYDIVPGVDALVASDASHSHTLGVFVADCVPILMADINSGAIAVVHAGWKGTLGRIAQRAVEQMKHLGSKPSDIVASIGPHISMCHYNVQADRVQLFIREFGNDEKMASNFQNTWHLDLGWVNYKQLTDVGVTTSHIDAPPTCTVCQVNEFYSYRIDTKETFGEILGVIGFAH